MTGHHTSLTTCTHINVMRPFYHISSVLSNGAATVIPSAGKPSRVLPCSLALVAVSPPDRTPANPASSSPGQDCPLHQRQTPPPVLVSRSGVDDVCLRSPLRAQCCQGLGRALLRFTYPSAYSLNPPHRPSPSTHRRAPPKPLHGASCSRAPGDGGTPSHSHNQSHSPGDLTARSWLATMTPSVSAENVFALPQPLIVQPRSAGATGKAPQADRLALCSCAEPRPRGHR